MQRGYHVQIYGNRRAPLIKVKELPKHFLNPLEGKNTIAFTTEEIIQADKRGQEALCEITVMSNSIIEELLQGVRESIGCLYKVRKSVLAHVLIHRFTQPFLNCLASPQSSARSSASWTSSCRWRRCRSGRGSCDLGMSTSPFKSMPNSEYGQS